MIILLTGAAGFIGFHAARALLEQGHAVIGVDNLNDYYDVALKRARLDKFQNYKAFEFHGLDIADAGALDVFHARGVTHILHLAAQAGVRFSLENPRAYGRSNVAGHLEVLEFARHCASLQHLAYASSSSVYGERAGDENTGFHETDITRTPSSLYAATKISGEMLAQSYAHLYKIPQTGLRFFTVYGPWGRPDMAYFIFTEKILRGEPITLFAPEQMRRDFTYVDDISAVLPKILQSAPPSGHEIYNLGNSSPNPLMTLVNAVEAACGHKADIKVAPKQKGDVSSTFADITAARKAFGFAPETDLDTGIARFVDWYRGFYKA